MEDFTTFTKVDPNTHIGLVGTDHIDFEAHSDEDAHLYKDKGAGHFTDFEHLIQIEAKSYSGNSSPVTCWQLTNDIDDTYGLYLASKTAIWVELRHLTEGTLRIRLYETYGGTNYKDEYTASWNTPYYLTIEKDGTALTCKVYDNAERSGDPLDTLSLTLHAGHSFQYIFAANTWNNGNDRNILVDIDSLDLQEGAVKTGSATLSGEGTLAGLGRLLISAKATTSGTGALSATASLIRSASATLSGTGSLSTKGSYLRIATATLSGTGSLSAQGGVYKLAAALLTGAGVLAASALVTRATTATLLGTGSLAVTARVIRAASAMLSGMGTLTAAGTIIEGAICGSATFSGTGALAAKAVYVVIAKATLAGIGTLTASAIVYTGLSPTLLAAQKKPDRLPYVEAKLYDYELGIKRLYYTRLYQGSEPDNHHGIAFDGQGSMHRIRAAASNTLYRQKITSPGPSSDYSQWTQIATDCAGPCAIAAYGAKVYIFYKTSTNVLWKYYSSNYGANWSNAQLVSYADVLSLAACWWGTGDIVVCFALKSNQLNGITLDTSTQTATQHTWSDAFHPLLDTYGIGAAFNSSTPAMEVVLAGKQSDSPYNHHDLFRTQFSNTYTFTSLESFLMAPDGEDITYEYPDCHLPSGAQAYETTRIVAVEKFTGITAYTRPLTSYRVKGTYWTDTTFIEPKPFLDETSVYGLRLSSTAGHFWMERPDGVWRAPRPADSPLDLTGDIVALSQSRPGTLVLELDNSKGQYASPGTGSLASLRFRSEIVLKLGYKTTLGDEALDAGSYWIDAWEYSSKPNMSRFIITSLDGSGLMDRWSARYQMRWNKDAVNPKSVWQVLYQVLARVGIRLTNTPPKPQSSAINNFYPDFTVNPGTGGGTAINSLLSFVPDQLVFWGQEAFTKNPLASESSCYSYGTDHAILTGKYGHTVTPSRSRALGRDVSDNRILEEALDWDLLKLAIDILDQDYDPNLQTAIRTQERADALLREASLRAEPGTVVVPTNVGQELLDVVDVTDARCGISGQNYRVRTILALYDRRQGIYTQRLALCAP